MESIDTRTIDALSGNVLFLIRQTHPYYYCQADSGTSRVTRVRWPGALSTAR